MSNIKDENVNVYIIDDDELHLRILKNKFVTSTSYSLYTYLTGEEFVYEMDLAYLQKRQVHIVILDYVLKTDSNKDVMDGLEVLEIIKKRNPKIEVIILSGNNDEDLSAKALELGANNYIRKNENSFLRLQNSIKWIISEKNLEKKRRDSKISIKIFILIIFIIILIFGILYIFFPILLKF